jgi:hypothetical protein
MVYVVTLSRIMPRSTRLEVFESLRDALERAAVWAGMNEAQALCSSITELEEFVVQHPVCAIQTAEFFPQLPPEPMETLYDSQ